MELDSPLETAFGPLPKYPIESVDNALRLLSLFQTNDRIRVKDAAQVLDVATGTAHRLLAMLQYRGYVAQDPVTKVYIPGSMLLSIGLQAASRLDIKAVARPHLKELRDALDETIQLAVLQGTDVLFVDGLETSKTLKVSPRTGSLKPAHCTSVGKALLADLSRDQLLDLYPEEKLVQATPRSIASRSQLVVELEATRQRGYALNFGELEEGIGSAAAAVRSRAGRGIAAIGAGAPLSRIDDVRLDEIAQAVVATAEQVSAAVVTELQL